MQTAVLVFIIVLTIFAWKSWKILSSVPDDTGRRYESKRVTELLRVNEFPLRDEFKESHPIRKGCYMLNFTDMDAGAVMGDNHPAPVIAETFQDAVSKMKRVEADDDENEIRIVVYDSNYEAVFIKYEYKKIGNTYPTLLSTEEMKSHLIRKGSYLLEYKTATDRDTDHLLKADLFTDALKKISSFDSHAEANIYDSNYDIVFYAR
jgi:hypothetical protein